MKIASKQKEICEPCGKFDSVETTPFGNVMMCEAEKCKNIKGAVKEPIWFNGDIFYFVILEVQHE